MAQFGPTVVRNATGQHSATVILLHGLGDSGSGIAPVSAALRLPHVKFVCPTAPTRPVSLNGGSPMPAWFDIKSIQGFLTGGASDPDIAASIAHVQSLVRAEQAAGVPPDRVVVAGFSQGGNIALKTALQPEPRLPACIALSTWLEPQARPGGVNSALRVFWGHGTADTLVPAFLADAGVKALQAAGVSQVELHKYPGMAHSTSAQEIDDVRDFLLRVIPDRPPPTREDVDVMSIKELKAFLSSRGVNTASFFEKSEMLEKARTLLR